MRDLGLVHVHGNGCDIGGPVAVLLESDDHSHFLGAYIEDKNGEKLVLSLIPKSAINKNIGWQRSAPYSERLLRHVATLDAVGGKGWGNTEVVPVPTEEPDEKPVSRKPPTRVFTRHGIAVLDRDDSGPLKPIKKKPATTTSPEVLAVKADLDNVMGKYKQIVKDKD